jgi:hypothetical protein
MNLVIDDGQQGQAGRFNDMYTHYMGRKVRLAVFWLESERVALGMAETLGCASSLPHCQQLLRALAERTGLRAIGLESAALTLHAHCRSITDHKTGWYSKENPNGVKRDQPKSRPRKMYL